VLGSLFLAQHRADDPDVAAHVVGRFYSLTEAQQALDACYDTHSWQGIRDETSGRRWWRIDGRAEWIETTRTRDIRPPV